MDCQFKSYSTTHWLGDLGQIPYILCASASSSVKCKLKFYFSNGIVHIKIFTECLPNARHHSGHLGDIGEQNKDLGL